MSSAADQGEPESERIRSLVREVAELREPHGRGLHRHIERERQPVA